jgi:hypothetical protein
VLLVVTLCGPCRLSAMFHGRRFPSVDIAVHRLRPRGIAVHAMINVRQPRIVTLIVRRSFHLNWFRNENCFSANLTIGLDSPCKSCTLHSAGPLGYYGPAGRLEIECGHVKRPERNARHVCWEIDTAGRGGNRGRFCQNRNVAAGEPIGGRAHAAWTHCPDADWRPARYLNLLRPPSGFPFAARSPPDLPT